MAAPVPSRRAVAKHLANSLAGGANPTDVAAQAAAYLQTSRSQKGADSLIADIAKQLETVALHGVATVTTARPLTATNRADIEAFIRQELGVKTVEIIETVDESLLGGVRIETPGRELDETVRARLSALTTTLTR